MSATTEDTGKKRSKESLQQHEEKPKKRKGLNDSSAKEKSSPPPTSSTNNEESSSPEDSRKSSGDEKAAHVVILDLESALHRVVGNKNDTNDDDDREYLTNDKYVKFRLGNARDAADIAAVSLKKSGETETTNDQQEPSPAPSLEQRLAESLGDDDTPPFVYSLVGDVVYNTKENKTTEKLAVVALMTLAWEQNECILRVEWSYVNPAAEEKQLLTRRLWLRLSAVALMTGSRVMVVPRSSFPQRQLDDAATEKEEKTP